MPDPATAATWNRHNVHVSTFKEFGDLFRGTVTLWWRSLPVIGLWCVIGCLLRETCTAVSVALGSDHRILASIMLVLGLLIWVTTLVVMLQVMRPYLAHVTETTAPTTEKPVVKGPLDDLVHAVVPFLVIYAVWGLGEEEATRAMQANLLTHPGNIEQWSISLAHWQLYLVMAVIGWGMALVMDKVNDHHDTFVGTIVLFLARGTTVLCSFLALRWLGTQALGWIQKRVFWYWLMGAWDSMVGLLPHWHLPFDLTLPEALNKFMKALGEVIIPHTLDVVLLPLVWVAMVAAVHGWRNLGTSLAVNEHESRLVERVDTVRRAKSVQRVGMVSSGGPLGLAVGYLRNNLSDLEPAMQAFRLIIRSGPRFVGAYLVLAAFVTQISPVLTHLAEWLLESQSLPQMTRWEPVISFITTFLATTTAMALYSNTFDATVENMLEDSQEATRQAVPVTGTSWIKS